MSKSDLLLEKAKENIEVADLLIREGHPGIALSRTYYDMFYIAEVLLYSKGLSFSSHSAVIAAYGKEFARTRLLNPEHHRHLKEVFEARQLGDYAVDETIPTEQAIEALAWATEFLVAAKDYLILGDRS